MEISSNIISSILKHDKKQNTYKIALLRSIGDVVLSYPDVAAFEKDIAIPIRVLAEFWLAYYFPFVGPKQQILQGFRSLRNGNLTNDIEFRPQLSAFRRAWESILQTTSKPSDGFFLINELRAPRKREVYGDDLYLLYQEAVKAICRAMENPVRYAGQSEYSVFAQPKRFDQLADTIPVPGTQRTDRCIVITSDLWRTFLGLSLWVEALCIHEWCLFTETVTQVDGSTFERGNIYQLLTDRPDSRQPLSWERHHIQLLMLEGVTFNCPWSYRTIDINSEYDLDHLVPVSVYPINEIWNLVPTHPPANKHKRDKVPNLELLTRAKPYLALAYKNYQFKGTDLARALLDDSSGRFVNLGDQETNFVDNLVVSVVNLMNQVAESRNLQRIDSF